MKKKLLTFLSNSYQVPKAVFGLFLISIFLLFGAFSVSAASESIENFRADIDIYQDGQVLVREIIDYNFADNERHGIFRDIPLTAEDGPTLIIDVQSVTDENNTPYNYTVSNDGNVVQIKIGDANKTITGTHTYYIGYRVKNAIRSFDDHEELYWNVTGNNWEVPIKQASAVVNIVQGGAIEVQTKCFTGRRGSQDQNCTASSDLASNFFSISQPLGSKEGLTLVFGFPLETIQNTYFEPPQNNSPQKINTSNSNGSEWLLLSVMFGLPLLGLLLFAIRGIRGWKPKPVIPRSLKGRPITIEYNPPENINALEMGTILDRRVDPGDISAVIIDLAVKGFLKIKYITTTTFFLKRNQFELVKLQDAHNIEDESYRDIFNMFFENKDTYKVGDFHDGSILGNKIRVFTKEFKEKMFKIGYFDINKKGSFQRFLIFFIIINIISLGFKKIIEAKTGEIDFTDPYILFGTSIYIIYFYRRLSGGSRDPISDKGTEILSKTLGFKEFLELTEKDKLELLNAPNLKPETFEKFLPYAMVLGVEEKWAKKFENIYDQAPVWYEDPNATHFNSLALASISSNLNTALGHSIRYTNSSSSGFSGGSSGGGSGGGGGGSW
jgi:uncharacterized membrane protein YgcG